MSRSDRWQAAAIAVLLAATTVPAEAAGQFEDVPPPAAYALQGVTVVRPDGTRSEGVTVVVRGDLIEAIGAEVPVPDDAEVLSGDSLIVYPGLFDGEGAVPFEFPEIDVEGEEVEPWNPPREVQGLLPQRRVVDHLEATGDGTREQRREGVVATAVHPDDALMPGRGALLLLRPDAPIPDLMVVSPSLGPVMAFRAARGAYPSQLFGLMAFFRQQFADAARHGRLLEAHRTDPRGMPTPPWDPAYEVIREIQRGEAPVFFRAEDAGDIRRALDLGRELGFRPVIVGGREAWKVAEELRGLDVPVLVSVDFPEPERWDPEEGEEEEEEEEEQQQEQPGETPPTEAPPGSADGAGAERPGGRDAASGGPGAGVSAAAAGQQEPRDPAVLREKRRLEEAYSNPARLAEAGVRFALTSGGGSADLREGARTAIEYGLSNEAALRALTSAPAEIYGVPHLSRLEPDYPATFIVADGPLFDEEARVVYAFVEGDLERFEERPAGGAAPAVDVTGTWEIEIRSEGFEIGGTMTLTQRGGAFDGTMETDMGTASVRDGVVTGSEIRFTVVPEGGADEVEVRGEVAGDSASGTGSSGEFSFRWSATREPGGVR